jgi:hypothetical protein
MVSASSWPFDQPRNCAVFTTRQVIEREDPNRPHNLWQPVPGDRGAHGSFDDRVQS